MQAQTQLQASITISREDSRDVRWHKFHGLLVAMNIEDESPADYPADISELFAELTNWEYEEDSGREADRNFRFQDSVLYKAVMHT